MNERAITCVGVYPSPVAAETAVSRLLAAGFEKEAISVILPAASDEHSAEHFQGVEVHGTPRGHMRRGAATGGAIGGLLGGIVAVVAAGATGGAALLVVGELLAGLATGGIAGGFVGAMTARGVEPDLADYYEQAVRRGRTLVAVETGAADGPATARAEAVLADAGAEPVELPGA
jgi:hypothetical protein